MGVGRILNKVAGELCDCELAPVDLERAVLTRVVKPLFGVATAPFRQVSWWQIGSPG